MARELARLVDEAPATDRDELRTYALGLVREEIRESEPMPRGTEGPGGGSSFNPLAMGIPVLLVGGFLVFLFPPVGLLLIAVAGFLVAWGVLVTLFSGRPRQS